MELLGNVDIESSCSDVNDALDIWCIKPHVVNRRLAGAVQLHNSKVEFKNIVDSIFMILFDLFEKNEFHKPEDIKEIEGLAQYAKLNAIGNGSKISQQQIKSNKLQEDILCKTLKDINLTSMGQINETALSNTLNRNENSRVLFKDLTNNFFNNMESNNDIELNVRKLIPRSMEKYESTVEIIVKHNGENQVKMLFIPIIQQISTNQTTEASTQQCIDFFASKSYGFIYDECLQKLHYYTQKASQNTDEILNYLLISDKWLENILVKKLKTWSEVSYQTGTSLRRSQSLSLVNVEEFTKLYLKLKNKYASYFIEIWPESTDPLKFVYEDISIAAYLLLLWKDERIKTNQENYQTFIDLGCGNGLLVHILSAEGHKGKGVDITRRKIWDLYGVNTVLEESSLQPETLLVNEDWIIGNHSDELTPWIPLIAARSSVRYFVLPCCFFDFFSKFNRSKQQKCQYEEYLEYVFDIGTRFGYQVLQDTLRIPSTKRICQIGERNNKDEIRINEQYGIVMNSKSISTTAKQNANEFKPRIVNNDPRNCTNIDLNIKNEIVDKITDVLLTTRSNITNVPVEMDKFTSNGATWSHWNPGGIIHLNELVKLFEYETLQKLKSQFGGLQTLLKNHGHIFKVINGEVCLRDYRFKENFKPNKNNSTKNKTFKMNKFKTRKCWFYEKHPHGCVFSKDECSYAHSDEDMQPHQIK